MVTVKEQVAAAKALSFHDCCRTILKVFSTRLAPGNLCYALAYCQQGMMMTEGSREARIQAAYIVNNLSHWRHPDASMIRARLRQLSKC